MRVMLLIFAAFLAAGGTGFFLFQELIIPNKPVEQPVAVIEAPKTTDVYVAAVEMQVGTLIVPSQLRRVAFAQASVTPEMVVADDAGLEFLTGSVVRSVLPKGVPIARSATVQPGERGFLAAVLPEGKRAVSIYVSEVAGISGLILPGDRVDVILTYIVAGGVIDAERDIRASETVLRNLRVLALDQRLGPYKQPDDAKGKFVPPPIARTATLEVTSAEAEMVTLATQLGDLSLVLNSVRDGGEAEVVGSGSRLDDLLDPILRRGPDDRVANASSSVAADFRPMTLDSDVTSLLQRRAAAQDAGGAGASPVALKDQISRVQVVRGSTANAVKVDALAVEDTEGTEEAKAEMTAN